MKPPAVTFITATYKTRPEHLQAALRAAQAQTFAGFEMLVSDDSPTDSLRELVEDCADPRIRYVHHAPARGVAGNHAWCLAQCRTEFVAVLNHDDTIEPAFLDTLLRPLRRDPGLALAFCDHWIIDPAGQRSPTLSAQASDHWGRAGLAPGAHRPFFDLLGRQTIPMAMGCVFRRTALIGAWPPEAGPAYDLWLTFLLARGGAGAYYVPDRLSSWRLHPDNLTTAGGLDWVLGSAACWAAIAGDPRCRSLWPLARRKAAAGYAAAAIKALRLRDPDAGVARRLATASLRQRCGLKALAAWALSTLPDHNSRQLLQWVQKT